MEMILTTPDPLRAGFVRAVLESRGIRLAVRNEFLAGALGELPAQECWVELWVAAEDAARARRILAEFSAAGRARSAWRCPGCDELIEPQFTQCWCCGTLREDAGAAHDDA